MLLLKHVGASGSTAKINFYFYLIALILNKFRSAASQFSQVPTERINIGKSWVFLLTNQMLSYQYTWYTMAPLYSYLLWICISTETVTLQKAGHHFLTLKNR